MSFIYTSMGNLYRRSWGSAYINKGGIDVVGELLSSFHRKKKTVEIISGKKKKKKGKWNFPQAIPNKIKVWRGWWKKKKIHTQKKQLSKTLAVLLRPNTPEPVSAFTVKKLYPLPLSSQLWAKIQALLKCHWSHRHADYPDICVQLSMKSPAVWYFDVTRTWCIIEVFRVSA